MTPEIAFAIATLAFIASLLIPTSNEKPDPEPVDKNDQKE